MKYILIILQLVIATIAVFETKSKSIKILAVCLFFIIAIFQISVEVKERRDKNKEALTGILEPNKNIIFSSKKGILPIVRIGRSNIFLYTDRKMGRKIFNFLNDIDLSISFKNERIKLTACLRNNKGQIIAKIEGNEWKVNPNNIFDRNYAKNALEVKDNDGNIILQVQLVRGIIELQGLFYGSNNSRINASYFNPKSDFSAAITLNNEWLLSRNSEREFLHRLGVSVGVYDQENFGSDSLWSISYQHEWIVGDNFVLRYGLSHSQHPYDGVQDSEDQISLMMDWRF